MSTISLIIPVYNAQKYVSACLDSVLNQTFGDFECICINDGSTDASLTILEEYARRDSRIVVISQPNKGVSEARNAGIKAAKSPYFQFLDPDDLLHPQTMEVFHNIITKYNVDFVQCRHVSVQENFQLAQPAVVEVPQNPQLSHNVPNDFFFCKKNNEVMVWLRMYRTSVFKDIAFPPNVHPVEDVVYTTKAVFIAQSAAFIPEKLIYYRQHGNSVMNKSVSPAYIDSHLRAGEILYQDISHNENLTTKQKKFLLRFAMRKLCHPVRKVIRTMPEGADKEKTLAELKQRLLALAQRGIFVPSILRPLDRLALTSFLQERLWLTRLILRFT